MKNDDKGVIQAQPGDDDSQPDVQGQPEEQVQEVDTSQEPDDREPSDGGQDDDEDQGLTTVDGAVDVEHAGTDPDEPLYEAPAEPLKSLQDEHLDDQDLDARLSALSDDDEQADGQDESAS